MGVIFVELFIIVWFVVVELFVILMGMVGLSFSLHSLVKSS
jgi:hypothetical protein